MLVARNKKMRFMSIISLVAKGAGRLPGPVLMGGALPLLATILPEDRGPTPSCRTTNFGFRFGEKKAGQVWWASIKFPLSIDSGP